MIERKGETEEEARQGLIPLRNVCQGQSQSRSPRARASLAASSKGTRRRSRIRMGGVNGDVRHGVRAMCKPLARRRAGLDQGRVTAASRRIAGSHWPRGRVCLVLPNVHCTGKSSVQSSKTRDDSRSVRSVGLDGWMGGWMSGWMDGRLDA